MGDAGDVLLSFVLAGALYGVAGATLLARTGSATPSERIRPDGRRTDRALLGSTTVRPGRFNVAGTIVGVLFVAVSVNGLTLAGAMPASSTTRSSSSTTTSSSAARRSRASRS